MGPKAKAGKGKKETDEERIAREAEEKKAADLEAKKRAKDTGCFNATIIGSY